MWFMALLACGPQDPHEARPLIDHEAWQTARSDPLPDHRPTSADCPDGTWFLEDGTLEVETGYCSYLSLEQPLLSDVAAGELIDVVVWHGELDAAEPAEGHAALLVDGQLIWETWASIPGGAVVYDDQVEAPHDLPAGSTAVFHLHNHGYNSWTLQDMVAAGL